MEEVFKSQREIVRYLDSLGFKISKSKLSRDKRKGLIEVNEDGSISKGQIIEYSASLDRKGEEEAPAELQAKKAAKEVESLEFKIKKQKFEYEQLKGKYIPRKDFEAELAARAVIFESGFRQHYSENVREWVALVGGKVEKTADLLQGLYDGLDKQLNQYSTLDLFQVLFEEEF